MDMDENQVRLELLKDVDREGFIKSLQWAFKYGATEEFGLRDNHFEDDGEIISRATIENSINTGTAYSIIHNNKKVGGAVVRVTGISGELDLLFVSPEEHSKGIGRRAWYLIEKLYPQVRKWETMTPYFERRNIHFYINKCGFKAVEFLCTYHNGSNRNRYVEQSDNQINKDFDGMFRFEKEIELRGGL